MRDFHDAKAMAQTLRDTLQAKAVTVSHSESLELISKILGVNDWNTLSALLRSDRKDTPYFPQPQSRYPAIPVRDMVAFPTMEFPLYVARTKTVQALDLAFERQREIVVVAQRDSTVEEPDVSNIFKMGVLASVIDSQIFPDGHIIQRTAYNGSKKILLQAHRRVAICGFTAEDGAFHAETMDISDGKIPAAPALIQQAIAKFESFPVDTGTNAKHLRSTDQALSYLQRINDPGRVADVIAGYLPLSVGDKQLLLETLDPVFRLEKVLAVLENATSGAP